jgi:hypothetical protein
MLIVLLFSVTYIKDKHVGPQNIQTDYNHQYPCCYAICTCNHSMFKLDLDLAVIKRRDLEYIG